MSTQNYLCIQRREPGQPTKGAAPSPSQMEQMYARARVRRCPAQVLKLEKLRRRDQTHTGGTLLPTRIWPAGCQPVASGRCGALPEGLTTERHSSRLPAVNKILCLLFTEGYLSSHAEIAIRHELCNEAIRLASILAEHPVGDVPETFALLAISR